MKNSYLTRNKQRVFFSFKRFAHSCTYDVGMMSVFVSNAFSFNVGCIVKYRYRFDNNINL